MPQETVIFQQYGYKIVQDSSGIVWTLLPDGLKRPHKSADDARAALTRVMKERGDYGKGSFGNCSEQFANGVARAQQEIENKLGGRGLLMKVENATDAEQRAYADGFNEGKGCDTFDQYKVLRDGPKKNKWVIGSNIREFLRGLEDGYNKRHSSLRSPSSGSRGLDAAAGRGTGNGGSGTMWR